MNGPRDSIFRCPMSFSAIMPILLLIGSNVFMTIAWYGHLKSPGAAMWVAVMMAVFPMAQGLSWRICYVITFQT